MHFQQPNMLWGLLLLAIPLLIHLFQFYRTQTIYFPGVFRLTQQLQQARQQRKLQHLLVLISRMLGLACLVFAFAMPSCEDALADKGHTHVVLVVDNGFSMGCSNADGQLLEQAKSQMRVILKGLNAETQVKLVSQTTNTNVWMLPNQIESVIDTLGLGPQRYVLGDWVERVRILQQDAGVGALCAMVFSDAQKSFMVGSLQKAQNENIDWRFVQMDLQSDEIVGGNLSLDTAWYISQFNANSNGGVVLKARVTHRGGDVSQAQLQLKLGDKTLFAQQKSISKNESIEFESTVNQADMGQGLKLILGDDGFKDDNELLLHPIKAWKTQVGVIGSNPAVDAMFQAQPLLVKRPLRLPLNARDFEALTGLDAIMVIGDVKLSEVDLAGLKRRVESGLVCLQFTNQPNRSSVKTIFGDVLQGEWKSMNERIALQGLNHPVFQGAFSETLSDNTRLPEIAGSFQPKEMSNEEVVVQTEGGVPLLLQRTMESGVLWIWLSDLQKGSKKLMESSWFLPMFTQIIGSKSVQEKPLYAHVFSKQLFPLPGDIQVDESAVNLIGKGGQSVVELQTNAEQHTSMYVGEAPSFSGMYRLESPRTGESLDLAFNWARNESVLDTDPAWKSLLITGGMPWKTSLGDGKSPILQNEPLKVLWRLFLWGAAFFFAVEVLLLIGRKNINSKDKEKHE